MRNDNGAEETSFISLRKGKIIPILEEKIIRVYSIEGEVNSLFCIGSRGSFAEQPVKRKVWPLFFEESQPRGERAATSQSS